MICQTMTMMRRTGSRGQVSDAACKPLVSLIDSGPAEVDLKTLVAKDQEDESLRKYKQALLGEAAEGKVAESDDPRRVIIESFDLLLDNHPDISIPLATPEDVARAQEKRHVFKEGETYRLRVRFRVQHDICLGLRMINSVYRLKMRGA